MTTTQSLLTSIAIAGLALLPLLQNDCSAGRYSSTPAYRAPISSPVYGFHPNGQSFTYRPSGTSPMYNGQRGAPGISSYGPKYRFDALTAPRTSTSSPSATYNQPYFFGGRLWYPRNP
jgi:hypothetical protein